MRPPRRFPSTWTSASATTCTSSGSTPRNGPRGARSGGRASRSSISVTAVRPGSREIVLWMRRRRGGRRPCSPAERYWWPALEHDTFSGTVRVDNGLQTVCAANPAGPGGTAAAASDARIELTDQHDGVEAGRRAWHARRSRARRHGRQGHGKVGPRSDTDNVHERVGKLRVVLQILTPRERALVASGGRRPDDRLDDRQSASSAGRRMRSRGASSCCASSASAIS